MATNTAPIESAAAEDPMQAPAIAAIIASAEAKPAHLQSNIEQEMLQVRAEGNENIKLDTSHYGIAQVVGTEPRVIPDAESDPLEYKGPDPSAPGAPPEDLSAGVSPNVA
jgi:hypothetical protein